MNGITVPKEFKVRRERTSREYSEAVIRDYVKARVGIPIKVAEIREALDGNTSAPIILQRLIRERRLIRRRVQKPGLPPHTYTYEWVELKDKIEPKHIVVENGETTTRRTEYATQFQLKRLDEWFIDFCSDNIDVNGANSFRKYVIQRSKGNGDN